MTWRRSRQGRLGLGAAALAGALALTVSPSTTATPRDIDRSSPGEAYAALGFGVFMHYGLATFVGTTPWNYDPHEVPATVYDPADFDPDQWMRAIKASGAKYLILTTKHHDGFALWPSAYTEYDVANSSDPNTDVVGEVVRAAREHGLEVAFYYSWWDKMEPGGNVLSGAPPTEHYIQFAKNQMRELLTQYGPVVGLWMDIPTGAPLRELADFIHGVSPETAFIPNLRVVSDAEDVTSFEGPDLEMMPCDYAGLPAEQAYNVAGGPGWWEMTADAVPRGDVGEAVSALSYVNSLDATLSLNVSPGPPGRFSPANVRLLEGIGDRVRGDDLLADAATTASGAAAQHPAGHATDLLAKTHWQVPTGTGSAWLRVDLAEPLTINRTAVQFAGAVTGYEVQYLDAAGRWRTALAGDAATRPTQSDRFSAVTTSSLRLLVHGASDGAGVVELKAYGGVNDTAATVSYEGSGWRELTRPAAFNQSLHRSRTAGDGAAFAFRGNGVELRAGVGPDQGVARISVDGGAAQTVDLYRATPSSDVTVVERRDLEPGDHTLTVEVVGSHGGDSTGSWVTLDRVVPLRVPAPFRPGDPYEELPDGRLAYDDSGNRCRENTAIQYVGPWQSGGWAGAYHGTRHFDYHAGTYAELSFEGTGVAVMTQTRPGHGIAAISVDGGEPELVDTYSDPAEEQVVVWSRTDLAPGTHTVRITVTGDKNPAATNTWIGLDAITVTP